MHWLLQPVRIFGTVLLNESLSVSLHSRRDSRDDSSPQMVPRKVLAIYGDVGAPQIDPKGWDDSSVGNFILDVLVPVLDSCGVPVASEHLLISNFTCIAS
jgi:hypothetical protein